MSIDLSILSCWKNVYGVKREKMWETTFVVKSRINVLLSSSLWGWEQLFIDVINKYHAAISHKCHDTVTEV